MQPDRNKRDNNVWDDRSEVSVDGNYLFLTENTVYIAGISYP